MKLWHGITVLIVFVAFSCRTSKLEIAAKTNNMEEVKVLLAEGKDPNNGFMKKGGQGGSPLHWACLNDSPEMVSILLQHGADYNSPHGHLSTGTPLFSAQSLEVAKLLIDAGCDVEFKDRFGKTALFEHLKHPDIFSYLLSKGVSPYAVDEDGYNVLTYIIQDQNAHHWNIDAGYLACIKNLIAEGFDLKKNDENNQNLVDLIATMRAQIDANITIDDIDKNADAKGYGIMALYNEFVAAELIK